MSSIILTFFFQQNGIVEPNENKGIVRLNALEPGRITISLKVSVSNLHSNEQFQIFADTEIVDEIEIQVRSQLSNLRNPFEIGGFFFCSSSLNNLRLHYCLSQNSFVWLLK